MAENLRHCLAFLADLHALHVELTRQRRPFDSKDGSHLALLKQLWVACNPNEAFCAQSDAWLRLGFQGPNPATGEDLCCLSEKLAPIGEKLRCPK